MKHDPEKHDRVRGRGSIAEQLSASAADADQDDDVWHVEGVAIGEGDVTDGASGKKTRWTPEVLEAAVDSGAVDSGKFLKSEGGLQAHKDPFAQPDPDNIAGSFQFDYEDGVGLTYSGEVIDEQLGRLVEHNLIDISPDLFRDLGEKDDDGVHDVDEILGIPYMTFVDDGAVPSNSVETAEAMAAAVDYLETRTSDSEQVEQLAIEGAAGVPDDVDVGLEDVEQLGELYTLRFSAFGEMIGDEFIDDAVSNLDAISGVEAVRSESNDDPELVAVLELDAVDSLDSLNESITSALEETPFEVHDGWSWIDRINDRLASQFNDPGGDGSGIDNSTMTDPEELREQIEQLEDERDELEDQVEQLEDQVDEKDDTIEQLEGHLQPVNEMLASVVADQDTLLTEQMAAEKYDAPDLVEMLASSYDRDAEDDEDADPYEAVSEQLSNGTPSPRGQGQEEDGPGGNLDDADIEQAEQFATSAMSLQDVQQANAEGLSKRDYLKDEYDVDPAEYDDKNAVNAAVNRAKAGGD